MFTGAGQFHVVGQSANPNAAWPRFVMRTYATSVNYDTGSMWVDFVRAQGETRRAAVAISRSSASSARSSW